MRYSHQSVTALKAAEDSPSLKRLTALVKDSSQRLQAIEPLIPATLRPHIKAGPIDGDVWCLLVESTAASAKLRQLAPALLAHLRTKGWQVTSIRLKVQLKA
jgi:hypothetical protein